MFSILKSRHHRTYAVLHPNTAVGTGSVEGAIALPPDFGRNISKISLSFKRPWILVLATPDFQTVLHPNLVSNECINYIQMWSKVLQSITPPFLLSCIFIRFRLVIFYSSFLDILTVIV